MIYPSSKVRIGLAVIAGLIGLVTVVALVVDVPRLFESPRTITVVFHDAQGLKPGTPVRVAGLEVGRVTAAQWIDQEGILRARVTLQVPERLAKTLKQDVQVTVSTTLAGQALVNITSTGASKVPLVDGQEVKGLEANPFTPSSGRGTAERDQLQGTINELRLAMGEVRSQASQNAARMGTTAELLRDVVNQLRPELAACAGQLRQLGAQLTAALPGLEKGMAGTMEHLDQAAARLTAVVDENRDDVRALVAGFRRTAERSEGNQEAISRVLAGNRVAIDRIVRNLEQASHDFWVAAYRIRHNPTLVTRPLSEADRRQLDAFDLGEAYHDSIAIIEDASKRLQAVRRGGLTPASAERLDTMLSSLDQAIAEFERTRQAITEQIQPNPGGSPAGTVPQMGRVQRSERLHGAPH